MEFSFEFDKPITKEFLLSKHPQERYMEFYTGIPVKKGLFISPLRPDNKPTCSYYKNKNGDVILNDFNGSFCGNFINVVMFLNSCTYYKALQIIANDFGFISRKDIKINTAKMDYSGEILEEAKSSDIRIEIQNFTAKELKWWSSFGISERTLKLFKVYSCKHLFLNSNLYGSSTDKSPMFGYYGGKKEGLEMWRIYMPARQSFRFLSNWKKNLIQGAHMLPKTGDTVVITKSMKDVMLLHELGVTAIAPNSETVILTDKQLENLKSRFTNVILFFDNDLPGISAMQKFRKKHNLKCVWLPRNMAKDISDFYKKYGLERTKEMINYGKEKIGEIQ